MEKLSFRDVQNEQARILKYVAKFLKNNDVDFFLYAGTLIGAIRHSGFIPWDDDVDIVIMRPDYDKLLRLVKNNRVIKCDNGDELAFYLPGDKNYCYPFIKVVNKSIAVSSKDKKDKELWIDVFPMDGVPTNNRRFAKASNKNRKLKNLVHIKNTKMSYIIRENRSLPNRVAKILLKVPFAFVPYSHIAKKMQKNAAISKYETSDLCSCLVWECSQLPLRFRKKVFEKSIPWEFEGEMYPIPEGYDELLGNTYGDYMKLPPKEDRTCHGVVAHRKN